MKLLKALLILLVILIAIPLILALFVTNDYALERDTIINVPKAIVFDHIRYLKNHDEFSIWAQRDSAMSRSYKGEDGTVGFVYKWNSKNSDLGSGEQEIVGIQNGKRIDYELRFIEPMTSTSSAYMEIDSLGIDKTRLEWGFKGHMNYPMNALLFFVDMDDMLGGDIQLSLDNLKKGLESQPKPLVMGTKAFLLRYHKRISDSLIAAVKALSSKQLQFKPAVDRWSIGQCLDHIIKSDKLLLGIIKEEMNKDPQPQLLDSIGVSDQQIVTQLADRTKRYQAPSVLEGANSYKQVDSALADYKQIENEILKFAKQTDIKAMRTHHSVYPFGNSDVYQALMSLAGHTSRHTDQIEQVKANKNFPKS
jgi:hypothetical protein